MAHDQLIASTFGFFSSGTWTIVRNVGVLLVLVFWIAIAVWVYKDARRRIEDPWLVVMATLIGLIPPFIGALVYLLLRPPEDRLATRNLHCPVCRAQVEANFLVCPVCTTKLKQACVNCKAPLEALWQVCPFCETPVAASPQLGKTQWLESSRPRRERRRAE